MTTTFYPGTLQWVGLAKETVSGTPVAAPALWIPVDPSLKHSTKITELSDDSLRGTMAKQHQNIAAGRYEEVTYKTYLYPDSMYAHLIAMMGRADAVSGTVDPWTHKTSLTNGTGTDNAQPPTYTIFVYEMNGKVSQIAGATLLDLKFEYKANDWCTIDLSWNGMPAVALTAPVNTPSALPPEPSSGVSIMLGGVAMSAASDLTVDIKRESKPIWVLNATNAPLAIYAGPMTVSGTINAIFQGLSDVNYTNYLNNVQPSLTVSSLAAGDATHPFTLQMSKVAYQSADPQGSATDWMTIQSAFNAMGNATDALDGKESPLQAILLNTSVTPF